MSTTANSTEHAVYWAWLGNQLTNREAIEELQALGHDDAESIVGEWVDEWTDVEASYIQARAR